VKRIAFFQSDLGVGGIQKSIVNLLRNLDYSRFAVDLYLSEKTEFWTNDFPGELNIRYLKPISRIWSFLPFDLAKKRVRYDFPTGVEYDLAVDFNSYQCSCAVGALTVPAKKRVMWIHNDVRVKLQNEWKYRVLWRAFKGKFQYYDGFVPVSRALEEPFRAMSGVVDKPFTVIQNYIDVGEIHRKMTEACPDLELDENCLNLVALGRLCHQKGYDLMLDIFAEASRQRDDLRLYIIGDGPDRAALEEQRERLGLRDKVTFLGNQPNPFRYMARMDAFLSTSRYEGQPLNIMEAMAVGLPLYCAKNLEKYTEGLQGIEDLAAALAAARKTEKHPDDLAAYNGEILARIEKLAEK
jgi:glycosyltransferase involved in cell wall biosynthesis